MIKNTNTMAIIALGLVLIVFIGLLKLGFWQLERAQQKRHYFERTEQLIDSQPLDVQSLFNQVQLSQQPVQASGKLLHQYTFLLDNVTFNGRVGYNVIVPMLVDDYQRKLVLINLGWVASTGYRDLLPNLQQWQGAVEVIGNLHQPTSNPFTLTAIEVADWPKVIGELNIQTMTEQLAQEIENLTLLKSIIRVSPFNSVGYQKQWLWVNMSVEKHLGYAMQWFALAFTLLILTAMFTRKKTRNNHEK